MAKHPREYWEHKLDYLVCRAKLNNAELREYGIGNGSGETGGQP